MFRIGDLMGPAAGASMTQWASLHLEKLSYVREKTPRMSNLTNDCDLRSFGGPLSHTARGRDKARRILFLSKKCLQFIFALKHPRTAQHLGMIRYYYVPIGRDSVQSNLKFGGYENRRRKLAVWCAIRNLNCRTQDKDEP